MLLGNVKTGEQLELRKDNSKGKSEFPYGKGGVIQRNKKVICPLHLLGQFPSLSGQPFLHPSCDPHLTSLLLRVYFSKAMVLKLEPLQRLVRTQAAGPRPHSFSCSRSGVGSDDLAFLVSPR